VCAEYKRIYLVHWLDPFSLRGTKHNNVHGFHPLAKLLQLPSFFKQVCGPIPELLIFRVPQTKDNKVTEICSGINTLSFNEHFIKTKNCYEPFIQ
jgi:hypothetical protein